MAATATQTYQQGVQNLQGWLDFLDDEESRLQAQLTKMQGNGSSLPEIDADTPELLEDDSFSSLSDNEDVDKAKPEKWT